MVSIDCSQTYLGNCFQNVQLQQDINAARSRHQVINLELTQTDQKKSRIYAKTSDGLAMGLVKQRDWQFTHGDVFQLEGDRLLLIHLNSPKLMTLSFDHHHFGNALKLIHLGHTLGNHHYPIVVTADRIYIQIQGDSTHLEASIKAFNIEGLKIGYETRGHNTTPAGVSPDQILNFEAHHH